MAFGGFKRAVRENVNLLIGLAAPSNAGKTYSALRLASGISNGKPFAVVDTEAGRSRHYAAQFMFDAADLRPPFRPSAYLEAVVAAEEAGYPVIVVDSMSHEHAGEGGVLAWHEAELDRLTKGVVEKREAMNMLAWKAPKADRERMVNRLLQLRCHLILCFRAKSKVAMVKEYDEQKRKSVTKIVPKKLLSGFEGMIPITDEAFLFELTASFLMNPEQPGVPIPIKVQGQHRHLFPLDRPLDEDAGRGIAAWASGRETAPSAGLERDDDQGPLISDAQVKQFKDAIRARSKELNVEAPALARTILGCFELENTAAISQALFPEIMDEIQRHGAAAPE